jgi:hypothetical protein
MALTQIKSSNILDGTIVNADINASAAIASTKLSGVESGLTSVQTFTASGTWTRPTGITKVIVEVQGAGGGGGRGTGGPYVVGGSAGGYARKFLDVSSISTSTITIGAGGAGATVNGNAGSDGGDSSWVDGTNTITGVKGVGEYSNYGTAVGGAATGGDINIKGSDGFNMGGSYAGKGGNSMFGFGGSSGWTGEGVPGAGGGYGSGGGGGYSLNGGAGTGGLIFVQEYK